MVRVCLDSESIYPPLLVERFQHVRHRYHVPMISGLQCRPITQMAFAIPISPIFGDGPRWRRDCARNAFVSWYVLTNIGNRNHVVVTGVPDRQVITPDSFSVHITATAILNCSSTGRAERVCDHFKHKAESPTPALFSESAQTRCGTLAGVESHGCGLFSRKNLSRSFNLTSTGSEHDDARPNTTAWRSSSVESTPE